MLLYRRFKTTLQPHHHLNSTQWHWRILDHAQGLWWLLLGATYLICKNNIDKMDYNFTITYNSLVPWGDETPLNRKGAQNTWGLQRNMWSGYGPNVDHQPVPIEQGAKLVPNDYYFISNLVGTKLSGASLVPASSYLYFISVIVGIKNWMTTRSTIPTSSYGFSISCHFHKVIKYLPSGSFTAKICVLLWLWLSHE